MTKDTELQLSFEYLKHLICFVCSALIIRYISLNLRYWRHKPFVDNPVSTNQDQLIKHQDNHKLE